jgi:hypothetical protein
MVDNAYKWKDISHENVMHQIPMEYNVIERWMQCHP